MKIQGPELRTSDELVRTCKIASTKMAPNVTSVHRIDREEVGLAAVDNVNVCSTSNMNYFAPSVVVDKLKE